MEDDILYVTVSGYMPIDREILTLVGPGQIVRGLWREVLDCREHRENIAKQHKRSK